MIIPAMERILHECIEVDPTSWEMVNVSRDLLPLLHRKGLPNDATRAGRLLRGVFEQEFKNGIVSSATNAVAGQRQRCFSGFKLKR